MHQVEHPGFLATAQVCTQQRELPAKFKRALGKSSIAEVSHGEHSCCTSSLFASAASAEAVSSEPTVLAAFAAFSLGPGAAPRQALEPLVPSLPPLSALPVA